MWKRKYGNGRVFYSSLGHQAKEFEVPEMATILRRGMNWAAREESHNLPPSPLDGEGLLRMRLKRGVIPAQAGIHAEGYQHHPV